MCHTHAVSILRVTWTSIKSRGGKRVTRKESERQRERETRALVGVGRRFSKQILAGFIYTINLKQKSILDSKSDPTRKMTVMDAYVDGLIWSPEYQWVLSRHIKQAPEK